MVCLVKKLTKQTLQFGGLTIGTSLLAGSITSIGGNAAGLTNISNIAFGPAGTLIGFGALTRQLKKIK